jgi:hypothetical protein
MPNASAELAGIAARLKAEGARGLRLQLLRGLKAAAAPLIDDVHEAARRQLPKSGGLNERVAAQKVKVSIRTGARIAGVRLTTSQLDTKETDQGYVRHPTFGRRGPADWKQTDAPAARGWWSETLAHAAPKATPELLKVMTEVSAEIMGRP